jgi:hypothetical protein
MLLRLDRSHSHGTGVLDTETVVDLDVDIFVVEAGDILILQLLRIALGSVDCRSIFLATIRDNARINCLESRPKGRGRTALIGFEILHPVLHIVAREDWKLVVLPIHPPWVLHSQEKLATRLFGVVIRRQTLIAKTNMNHLYYKGHSDLAELGIPRLAFNIDVSGMVFCEPESLLLTDLNFRLSINQVLGRAYTVGDVIQMAEYVHHLSQTPRNALVFLLVFSAFELPAFHVLRGERPRRLDTPWPSVSCQ